jgi:hypothetical protein
MTTLFTQRSGPYKTSANETDEGANISDHLLVQQTHSRDKLKYAPAKLSCQPLIETAQNCLLVLSSSFHRLISRKGFLVCFQNGQHIYIPSCRDLLFPVQLYGQLGLSQKRYYFSFQGKLVHDTLKFSAQSICLGSSILCCLKVLGGGKDKDSGQRKRKAQECDSQDQMHSSSQQEISLLLSDESIEVLQIQNVETGQKGPMEFHSSDLSQTQCVEELCNLITKVCHSTARNRRSAGILGLRYDGEKAIVMPFLIMELVGEKEFVRLDGRMSWIFSELGHASGGNIVYLKVFCKSVYEKISPVCVSIFTDPDFFEKHREPKDTIYDFLGLPPRSLPEKQVQAARILGEGLRPSAGSAGVQDKYVIGVVEQQSSAESSGGSLLSDNWRSEIFPEKIYISDLHLTTDNIIRGGQWTLGLESLKRFLVEREKNSCSLNCGVEHSGRNFLESPTKCYGGLRVYCRGKDKNGNSCSHSASYSYVHIPQNGRFHPDNTAVPIFTKNQSHGTTDHGNYHNCVQSVTVGDVGRGVQAKQGISQTDLEDAIFLVKSNVPLRLIVHAFGNDPSNPHEFQATMTAFRNKIAYKLRSDSSTDMHSLFQYFDESLESGHIAYVCMERVPGSTKTRIYWQSAEEILFLKERKAAVMSLDFVYKMIPGFDMAFGIFTAMSSAGHLVPVAAFLVESESSDALEWIFGKFDEIHRKFGFTRPSPVSLISPLKIFFVS